MSAREPQMAVTIAVAAKQLGTSTASLRRWLRDGAPQARRGRRGRGGQALLDPIAIAAWRAARNGTGGSTAALETLAADAPEILARAVWRTYQLVEHDPLLNGHARRTVAGALMVAWLEVAKALLARIAIDAPDVAEVAVLPEEIARLARHLRRDT